jgi:hypothetical protein
MFHYQEEASIGFSEQRPRLTCSRVGRLPSFVGWQNGRGEGGAGVHRAGLAPRGCATPLKGGSGGGRGVLPPGRPPPRPSSWVDQGHDKAHRTEFQQVDQDAECQGRKRSIATVHMIGGGRAASRGLVCGRASDRSGGRAAERRAGSSVRRVGGGCPPGRRAGERPARGQRAAGDGSVLRPARRRAKPRRWSLRRRPTRRRRMTARPPTRPPRTRGGAGGRIRRGGGLTGGNGLSGAERGAGGWEANRAAGCHRVRAGQPANR